MRKACSSPKTERTTRLMACALARSWPSGFSSTTRTVGPFSPAAPSCAQIVCEQVGAVARYITTTSARRCREPRAEAAVVLGLRQVHRQVVDEPGEARELLVGRALRILDLVEALLQPRAIAVVVEILARDAEDASAFGQLAVAEGLEQRRHQLAPRQVAGAAEEHEVEGHADRIRCFAEAGHDRRTKPTATGETRMRGWKRARRALVLAAGVACAGGAGGAGPGQRDLLGAGRLVQHDPDRVREVDRHQGQHVAEGIRRSARAADRREGESEDRRLVRRHRRSAPAGRRERPDARVQVGQPAAAARLGAAAGEAVGLQDRRHLFRPARLRLQHRADREEEARRAAAAGPICSSPSTRARSRSPTRRRAAPPTRWSRRWSS